MAQEGITTSGNEIKPIANAPKITRKKSKDDIEITDEQARYLESIPIPEGYKKKQLFCRIWNETGTRTIGKKKITYGTPFFTMRIAGRHRYFRIIYNVTGMIKLIEGKLYYDVAYDNSLGGLALRNTEFPEDMLSEEAYTTFVNNGVNMYVKKGGIPMLYLLVAMGMVLVMAIAIIAVVPSGFQAQDQVKQLDKQVSALKAENTQLKQQVNNLQNGIGTNTGVSPNG